MNGFIKRTLAVLCVGGAASVGGCAGDCKLCDFYDNCWPTRYGYQADQSILQTFGAQVNNGHILDQTVFTYHFEPGTDKLSKGGQEHLMYLARRRPLPDTMIYVQTAQDIVYDPAAPEQFAKDRSELDGKRVQAVQRFLNAETAGRPVAFTVALHDAPTPGLPATPLGRANLQHYGNFQGAMSAAPASGAASSGAGVVGAPGASSSGSVNNGAAGTSTPR